MADSGGNSMERERTDTIRHLYDRMCMGIITSLEKRPGVTDVKLKERRPAQKHTIANWESRNGCVLPEDFKTFLLTSDGLLLCWSAMFKDETLQLGRLHLNSISQLKRVELLPISEVDTTGDTPRRKSTFDCLVIELDPCEGDGCVGMVYNKGHRHEPEVWFCDRSGVWYYMTASFVDYFRLMIMHLGLPWWQYAFTDAGLSPLAKQWFHLYAPVRLAIDTECLRLLKNGIGLANGSYRAVLMDQEKMPPI
eukprot:Colp12_sorted_trinity150504_noHs@32522